MAFYRCTLLRYLKIRLEVLRVKEKLRDEYVKAWNSYASFFIAGTLGMFFQIFLSTGVVFIYLLGIMNSYHAICGIGGCVTALYLIALYHIPESPIHLLRNGHEEEAIRSLKMLRGPEYDVQSEIVLIKRELRDLSRENTSLAVGLTKPNLKAVELTVSLMVISCRSQTKHL